MKHNRNETLEFFGGLAMLVVGLYWLFTNVTVSSGFFSGVMSVGGTRIANGVVIIPFIVAVILLFIEPQSFWRRIFAALTVLLIIAAIVLSTRFRLNYMSMFEWIGILIFIFGGGALVCKTLFGGQSKD